MKFLVHTITTVLLYCFPLFAAETESIATDVEVDMPVPDDTVADSVMQIEKMPEVIYRVEPEYPIECARRGIEGKVVLDCVLSDSGKVDSVYLVTGVHPLIDSAAICAMRQFRFTPAMVGEKPVAVLLQYEIPFVLMDVAAEIRPVKNLSGTLRESGTRAPISDAFVIIHFPDTACDTALNVPFGQYLSTIGSFDGQQRQENSLVTVTDSLGRFGFYSLPACSVIITSPHAGYIPIKERELISHGEELSVTYYMQRASYNDYEIVVYGKSEEKEVVRRRLDITEARKIPGIGNDAVRVVQAMPGVGRPSFGSGDIVVRGAPSWDSKFYLDGTELPVLYHFGGLKSVYNPDALESIDFYPGGWSSRYGGAVAGVIELKGREAKKDRWHGQLDLNMIDGSFLVEGPVTKKVSVLASARRSFIGDIASWYIKKHSDLFPFTVAPYYYDILGRTDIEISKRSSCFVSVLHSRDSLGIFIPSMQGGSSEMDEATNSLGVKIQFTTGSAGWDFTFSPKLKNSLRYSLSRIENDMSVFGFVKVNELAMMHHLRNELTFTPSEKINLAIGADVSLVDEDMILQIISGSGAINRDTTENWLFGDVAAYANLTFEPADNLQIVPGIRYDYYPELTHDGGIVPELWNYSFMNNHRGFSGEPSARLSVRYRVQENQTLKAAIGTYNQTPQPIGQVIHKTWGDPSIGTTKASQYLAGYEWRVTDYINADLQLYLNRQWDLPRQATTDDLRSDPKSLWLSDGKGKMKGVELMLRHDNNSRFFGWIAYTLSRSERWNPNKNRYEIYSQDETHHLQLVASWHLKRDWDVGCRVRYVTGKPTTPIIGAVENEQYSYFEAIYGEENSGRIAPFFQIDLRVDKKIVYNNWIFSLYFDIQNISWLFYKSPEMVIYNYNYTDKQNVSMIMQPAFGVKAEF